MGTASAIRKNAPALIGIQLLNYAVPIVLTPLLVNRLGSEVFGHYTYVMACASLLTVVADFGSNQYVARKISLSQNQPERKSEIILLTLISKIFILVFIGFILGIIMANRLWLEPIALLTIFTTVVGSSLTPTWYYTGLELLPKLAITTAAVRVSILFVIYKSVRDSHDINLTLILNGFSSVLIAILLLPEPISQYKGSGKPRIQIAREALIELKQALPILVTNLATTAYTSLNIILLRHMTSLVELGAYAAADKVVKAVQGILSCVPQAVNPLLTRLHEKKQESKTIIGGEKSILKIQLLICIIATALLCVGAKTITETLYKKESNLCTNIIQILSVSLIFGGISSTLNNSILYARGLYHIVSKNVILGACVSVPLFAYSLTYTSIQVAAAATVVVEVIVLLATWRSVKKSIT